MNQHLVIPDIIIQAVSHCPNSCRYCSIKKWRSNKPDYVYNLTMLQNLLESIRMSGYSVKNIYFGGGEPLRWVYLIDAIDMVNKYGIDVIIYTTGIRDDMDHLIRSLKVKKWVITLYDWNYDDVIGFGKYDNVELNKTEHAEYPKVKDDNSVPANCVCSELSVEGDYIYACHGVRLMGYDYPYDNSDYSSYYTDVSVGFMDRINRDMLSMELCKSCISNKNIQFVSHKILHK